MAVDAVVVERTDMRVATDVVDDGRTGVRLAADFAVAGRTGMRLAADAVVFGLGCTGMRRAVVHAIVVGGRSVMRLAANVVVGVGSKRLYSANHLLSNAPIICFSAFYCVFPPSRVWPGPNASLLRLPRRQNGIVRKNPKPNLPYVNTSSVD